MFLGAWVAFSVLRFYGGSAYGSGLLAQGTTPSGWTAVLAIAVGAILLGLLATLSGACPLRQHVLAGQGRRFATRRSTDTSSTTERPPGTVQPGTTQTAAR